MQTRMAQKLSNGKYTVPRLLAFGSPWMWRGARNGMHVSPLVGTIHTKRKVSTNGSPTPTTFWDERKGISPHPQLSLMSGNPHDEYE